MDLVISWVVGLGAGLLGGLLGVGGGVVMVPGQVLFLGVDQHTAQGTSLTVIALLASLGAWVQRRQGNVRLRIALIAAPAAALFSVLGAWGAGMVPARALALFFAAFLVLIGARMALRG